MNQAARLVKMLNQDEYELRVTGDGERAVIDYTRRLGVPPSSVTSKAIELFDSGVVGINPRGGLEIIGEECLACSSLDED